tara:strand:+ start:599 stop:793 length:195 start_codon:yes stop_codon:yes gene_type:complete
MLQKIIINKIVNLISKQFKLHKIMQYVEEPNDADARIDKLEATVFQLSRLIEIILRDKPKNKEK